MAGGVPRAGDGGELSPERLAALLAAALPGEELTADELAATLYDDPAGAVLGDPSGDGAVGVAVRGSTGFVTVVVVDPGVHRQGRGAALLEAAHGWLRDRGATRVVTGASAPRYLWPGVDVEAHGPALALFGAAGYEEVDRVVNHRCAVTYRAAVPDGVSVRRVVAGSPDAAALLGLAGREWSRWVDELGRAMATGCCHGAFTSADDDGVPAAIGFGCHSVNRAGWIGPMATDPAWQGRGVGSALLGAVGRDLELAEFDHAEIAWVGPDAFYEKAAGSTVSRRFAVLARPL
jgi:GNAT superfamily N-acetyltransferase